MVAQLRGVKFVRGALGVLIPQDSEERFLAEGAAREVAEWCGFATVRGYVHALVVDGKQLALLPKD